MEEKLGLFSGTAFQQDCITSETCSGQCFGLLRRKPSDKSFLKVNANVNGSIAKKRTQEEEMSCIFKTSQYLVGFLYLSIYMYIPLSLNLYNRYLNLTFRIRIFPQLKNFPYYDPIGPDICHDGDLA